MGSSKQSEARLYETARRQAGFFTTRQAILAGYPDTVHAYHLRNGDWERVRRGVYRLHRYPEADQPERMIWWLWAHGRDGRPRGVFSHLSALALHGLAHTPDGHIHLTIPPVFKRSFIAPPALVLHRARLLPDEIVRRDGFAVTTIERTRRDLEKAGLLATHVPAASRALLRRQTQPAPSESPAPPPPATEPEPATPETPPPDRPESWAVWA